MQDKFYQKGDSFSYIFEKIMEKFIQLQGAKQSRLALSRFLEHEHEGKVKAWSRGQWPNAQDCWSLHRKLGLNLQWLLTGEGEMLRSASPAASLEEASALRQRVAELEQKLMATQEKLLQAQEESLRLYRRQEGGASSIIVGGAEAVARGARGQG